MSTLTFDPIGYVSSCFKEKFGTPRQPSLVPSSWGVVQLRPEMNLDDALEGLDGFSHAWLIFVFHQNTNKGLKKKVHPPRMNGEKLGLFATRTPHRPNPIGLSAVKIERLARNEIYFTGGDLVDGTPILDVKPYLPSSDIIENAVAGWTSDKPTRTLSVIFLNDAVTDLARLFGQKAERAQAAIKELLELDPRPNFYKGTEEAPNPYTDVYGFRFDDFNVVYRMVANEATVMHVQPWQEHERTAGFRATAISGRAKPLTRLD